jgi:hypothetical protein
MAYSSFPNPLPPSNAGPILLAVQRPIDLIVPPDQETLVSRLREAVTSGAYDLERIAGALAEAAHTITDASGAAVALRRENKVICVGRSGETAPPLGTPLSAQSGISGECLRGSVIIRCDDTLLDSRVDAVVCEELGIRSVVAVPLRGGGRTVGIIEVFAASPGSFTDAHVRALRRLGELAESANRAVLEEEPQQPQIVLPVPVLANPAPSPEPAPSWGKHRQQLIAAAAVLFFFAAGWVVSAKFQGRAPVTLPTVQAAPEPSRDDAVKPSPGHPVVNKQTPMKSAASKN